MRIRIGWLARTCFRAISRANDLLHAVPRTHYPVPCLHVRQGVASKQCLDESFAIPFPASSRNLAAAPKTSVQTEFPWLHMSRLISIQFHNRCWTRCSPGRSDLGTHQVLHVQCPNQILVILLTGFQKPPARISNSDSSPGCVLPRSEVKLSRDLFPSDRLWSIYDVQDVIFGTSTLA